MTIERTENELESEGERALEGAWPGGATTALRISTFGEIILFLKVARPGLLLMIRLSAPLRGIPFVRRTLEVRLTRRGRLERSPPVGG